MAKARSEIFEFDYFGMRLWYDMDLYDGTIWTCGAETADKNGTLDLWDAFTSDFQEKLYKVIQDHAEDTFWSLRRGGRFEDY